MIAIVGAGAMGGWVASALVGSGNEVVLVDVSDELVQRINKSGLIVRSSDGEITVGVRATTNPADVGSADVVVFFVKANHTHAAAQLAKPMVSSATTVVSLQNGWGNADVLAEIYSPEQIVVGVTYHSATVAGLAEVLHTGKGPTFVGPYADEADFERALLLAETLNGSDVETTATENVKTEIWKKLILNAATLPTAALTRLCAGDLFEHKEVLTTVDELAAEAVSVARAQGMSIDLAERLDRIHTVLKGAGKGKASMLQDVEARRKTEIEVVNGAIVSAAERAGVAVPLNEVMIRMVHGLERSWIN